MNSNNTILSPSHSIKEFIKSFEGFRAVAIHEPIDRPDVYTIGYGTIMYPDGSKVKPGDKCTPAEAQAWLEWEVDMKGKTIAAMVLKFGVNQNQYDALVSFAYNEGLGALSESTLLRKLKINSHDKTIFSYARDEHNKPVIKSCEFLRYVYSDGEIIPGLVRRRAAEADLYGREM